MSARSLPGIVTGRRDDQPGQFASLGRHDDHVVLRWPTRARRPAMKASSAGSVGAEAAPSSKSPRRRWRSMSMRINSRTYSSGVPKPSEATCLSTKDCRLSGSVIVMVPTVSSLLTGPARGKRSLTGLLQEMPPRMVCILYSIYIHGAYIVRESNLTPVRFRLILYTMNAPKSSKLNQLGRQLPEGLLVDAAWLEKRGYYGSLRKKYVDLGWLEQPAHRVYRRPRGMLSWEQVVISLQTLLAVPVSVGGRTALERQGFAHYLSISQSEVHLYGHHAPPTWLHKLPLSVRFVFHKSDRLFVDAMLTDVSPGLAPDGEALKSFHEGLAKAGLTTQPWGHWNWPLVLSTPERSILELLDELPERESFHHADKLMEGLASLSPRRMQMLLEACRNVKVKRLFLFFADRHNHAWLKRLDRQRVDLGAGKRMLVRGGRLDRTYGITVPEDMDAVH